MATIDDIKDRTGEQAGALAGRAKGIVTGEIDRRAALLGSIAVEHAQNVRELGDSLRARGEEPAANLADAFASRVESAGYYLSESGGERILSDAEALARRQPLLTFAFGLAAGIAAARLLKAGATQRYASYNQNLASDAGSATRYFED